VAQIEGFQGEFDFLATSATSSRLDALAYTEGSLKSTLNHAAFVLRSRQAANAG
jgi:hypothetical protein